MKGRFLYMGLKHDPIMTSSGNIGGDGTLVYAPYDAGPQPNPAKMVTEGYAVPAVFQS